MSKTQKTTNPNTDAEAKKWLTQEFLRAVDLHKSGKIDEAEAAYFQILKSTPNNFYAWRNLGALQRRKGNLAASIACAKRGVELGGLSMDVVGNIENALIDAGRAPEAMALGFDLLPKKLPEKPAEARIREARLRRSAGFAREACRLFESVLQDIPNNDTKLDYAMSLLESGQYRKGFEHYECRWETNQIRPPQLSAPKWNLKDDITGKDVLVFCEQGLGDWIFLSRFLPRLRAEGVGRLRCVVRPQLVRLMEASKLADEVHNRDGGVEIKTPDCWLSAFDLCRLYLDEDQPFQEPAAFHVPEDSAARGKEITAAFQDRLKVGVCWATSPTGRKAQHKSVDPFLFMPLVEVGGTQFFSLYKGKDDDILVRNGLQSLIIDSGRSERDMADTAGLIQNLDLVITVDTAVAHLAASLGVPTWILVPEAAFWYWRPFGEACRFYPSARLIRQVYPGDWEAPFARMKLDLERMLR